MKKKKALKYLIAVMIAVIILRLVLPYAQDEGYTFTFIVVVACLALSIQEVFQPGRVVCMENCLSSDGPFSLSGKTVYCKWYVNPQKGRAAALREAAEIEKKPLDEFMKRVPAGHVDEYLASYKVGVWPMGYAWTFKDTDMLAVSFAIIIVVVGTQKGIGAALVAYASYFLGYIISEILFSE